MFDVDWTDPEAEKVGERRARKGAEQEVKKKEDARRARESVSSRSSLSSADKAPGFLSSLGLKLGSTSLRSKRTSPRPSIFQSSSSSGSQKRASVLSQSAVTESVVCSSEACTVPDEKESDTILPIQGADQACSARPLDPPTDGSPKGSRVPEPTKEGVLSPPSPSTPPKTVPKDQEPHAGTAVDIPAPQQTAGPKPEEEERASEPKTPEKPALGPSLTVPVTEVPTSLLIHEWFTSVHGAENAEAPSSQRLQQSKSHLSSFELKPPSASGISPSRTAFQDKPIFPTPPTKLKAHNPKSWRSPDTWDYSSVMDADSPSATSLQSSPTRGQGSPTREQDSVQLPMTTLDLAAVQREVTKMAAASPEIITVRLTEDWGFSNDASFYKELEMEKQRWMLSALRSMCVPGTDTTKQGGEGQKILAMFESQATASYLAAIHPKADLVHLAPKPLSNVLFPNVRPIPCAVRTALPVESNTFNAAYCLSLSSLMAGRDIPRVLKHVHRCLVPRGVLYLILVDPSPASGSLGPRMREWLDQNLVLNLEARFRCRSPTRLFPAWLADARLRANGSVITKVKFSAIYQRGQKGVSQDQSPAVAELQSTVGRKLWQDVWGKFVHGPKWWWEDEECVEECLRLGTYFDINMIEAVKDTV